MNVNLAIAILFLNMHLKDKAIVTAIGLELDKQWRPNLSYGPLQSLDLTTVTPKQVFDVVVKVRQEKLPDPCCDRQCG